MSDKEPSLIVIKRVQEVAEEKKGGAWKVAHADFMTAMMAFFLIMWLVNATDEEIKKSIANYFNPMNLMSAPSDDRGIDDPTDDAAPPDSGKEAGQRAGDRPLGSDTPGQGGGAHGGGNVEEGNDNRMDSAGILQQNDGAAFNDPYATLASAAADIAPEVPVAIDVPQSNAGTDETTAANQLRNDPFDPAHWPTRANQQASSPRPAASKPGATQTPAEGSAEVQAEGDLAELPSEAFSTHGGPTTATAPRSAAAAAVIAQFGDSPETQADAATDVASAAAGKAADDAAEAFAREAAEIAAEVAGAHTQVEVSVGSEAVLISLTDGKAFSMFAIGSAEPTPAAAELFARVAAALATRDGRIVVRGHTDARPFATRTSDNWVLSFARAHASKTVLVANGVSEARIARVEGLADREPSVPEDPLADANRRIEILYEPAGETP